MRVATSPSSTTPLALVEVEPRVLRRDEVRVRVAAIGVNPVDWKMREGGPLRLLQQLLGPRGPFVTGIDFAGTVVEARPGGDLPVGTRVVGGTDFSRGQRGSYADEVVVRPDQCVALPDAVSFQDAACMPVAAVTAWVMLTEHARVRAGGRVLVLGASGGVGLFALQLARMLGAEAVGVCSTRNTTLVERLGAQPIDYTRRDPLVSAAQLGPYDLIVQAVGTASYALGPCRRLLAPGGIVDLAVLRPADVPGLLFGRGVRTVLGRPTRARLGPLVDGLARGALTPVVETTFPLAEAEAAHARSRAGKVVGKLLLVP